MKKILIGLVTGALLLVACSAPKKTESISMANSGKVWASLWQQRSAEYRALCFQAYSLAKLRLDEAIKHPGTKPFAVITDVDETLLDNSPYDAMRAVNNLEFDAKTWKVWTAKAQADTVPGAPAFFKYAASKGVAVFYVTNRDEDERAGTLKNLQLYNLPNTDDAHLLLRQTASSKESRRQSILKTHQIILLCGDNLPDFDLLYDNHPTEQNRQAATDRLKKEFGDRYIIIPNLAYGDFEGAWFNFNYKLSPMQKDSIIKAKLKTDKQ